MVIKKTWCFLKKIGCLQIKWYVSNKKLKGGEKMKGMYKKEYIKHYSTNDEDYIFEYNNVSIFGHNIKFPKKIIYIKNNEGFKEACVIDIIDTNIQKDLDSKSIIKIRYKEYYVCIFFDVEFQIFEDFDEETHEFFLSIRNLVIKNTETINDTLINKIKYVLEIGISLCLY